MSRCLIIPICFCILISGCTGRSHRVEEHKVTFKLDLPAARQVDFAYSLDGFRLQSVQQKQDGTWEISVPADIEFKYFFMVDGAVHLPGCEIREADDFGYENCIFEPVR